MKLVFLTNSISPHQLPLAQELISLLGYENYSYIYTDEITDERKKLGWNEFGFGIYCSRGDASEKSLIDTVELTSGIRASDVFEINL